MSKRNFAFLALFASLVVFAANPKYVFLFIGDGMSVPQRMLAEEFSKEIGRGPLTLNSFPMSALTRTCSANALITDSAAAATAIACGEKTKNGQLGVSEDCSRKLESSALVAHRDGGKKVGIVTSVTINHATPAGFYAHQPSRGLLYRIGLDLVDSGFEYFGGGGFSNQFDKKDDEQYRGNLYDLAAEKGYTVIRDREGLLALSADTPKVLALYKEDSLPFAIDGDPNQPTLAQFVSKGIEILQHDAPNGFFFMVEGGAIDYRGHANDAAGNLREVLAFDDALKVAYDFYLQHPEETLIVTTGDHETGGMTIGFAGSGYGLNFPVLEKQKCTPETFQKIYQKEKGANPALTFDEFKPFYTKYFGFLFEGNEKDIMFVKPNELADLQQSFASGNVGQVAKVLLQTKAGIGWSSGNHTALPVLTTAIGCRSEIFCGMLENTDIAKKMKSIVVKE